MNKKLLQYYCKDCGKIIHWHTALYRGGRCSHCACKEKLKDTINSPNYIDGRTSKKYYCQCGHEICYQNFTFGQGRCYSCAKLGKNNNNYIDGRKPFTNSIRALDEYTNWRNKVFKRDNYTCQCCGQIGHVLNIHHEKPFSQLLSKFLKKYSQFSIINDKETLVRLAINWKPFWEIENGKTLCKKCHKKISTRR